MKKIILFIAIATLAFSCSSEDDSAKITLPTENIAGKWQRQSEKLDGVSRNLTACEKLDTYSFTMGIFNDLYYSDNDTNGCSSQLFIGTYKLAPNSTDDYIIEVDEQGTVFLSDVIFNSNLSLMTTRVNDGPSVVETVWKKIN